jgi:hypothetical protein
MGSEKVATIAQEKSTLVKRFALASEGFIVSFRGRND